MNDIINQYIQEVSDKFNQHLENYVLENLQRLGFSFKDKFEFLDFVQNRLTRITQETFTHTIYLDYDTDRTIVGIYSDESEVNYDFENMTGKTTITFKGFAQ